MALSRAAASRVLIVGKDPVVTRTLSRLLSLDDQIEVLGEASSLASAGSFGKPDVIVLDEAPDSRTQAQPAHLTPETKVWMLAALREMTVAQAIEAVKGQLRVVQIPERRALAALTARELEVVRLVADGLSNKEISSRLRLSDKTVKNHISHILAKMNLNARTQVAVYAIRGGLV